MFGIDDRDKLLRYVVPAVMVAVALHQIHLATTADLSSWKGGGFGMFASVDRHDYRALRGSFVTTEGEYPFDFYTLQEELGRRDDKLFVNARALPDDRRLRQVEALIMSAVWELDGEVAVFSHWLREDVLVDWSEAEIGTLPVLREDAVAEDTQLEVLQAHLQVWALRYERDEHLMWPELIVDRAFYDSTLAGAP